MPRATMRPPRRATNTTAAARSALATSLSWRRRRQSGIEEDEVGAQLGDEMHVASWRNDTVDGEEEPEGAKFAEPRQRELVERGVGLGANDPGELARVQPQPPSRRRDGELAGVEQRVRQRDEQHGRSGVLGKRQRRDDDLLAAAPAGRGSASYPRSTPSTRSMTGCNATPGRLASAVRSDDALPIIAASKLPLDSFSDRNASLVVPVTRSHRASNKTVSTGRCGRCRRDPEARMIPPTRRSGTPPLSMPAASAPRSFQPRGSRGSSGDAPTASTSLLVHPHRLRHIPHAKTARDDHAPRPDPIVQSAHDVSPRGGAPCGV